MPSFDIAWPEYTRMEQEGVTISPNGDVISLVHEVQQGSLNKVWGRTVDFFNKKRTGVLIPPQPFELTVYQSKRPVGDFTRYPSSNPGSWVRSKGNLVVDQWSDWQQSPEPDTTSWPGFLASQKMCESQLLKRIKGSTIDLGLILGERQQTARLIGNTAVRLATSINYLKRGNLVSAVSNLVPGSYPSSSQRKRWKQRSSLDLRDRASTTWLELQYGWKPLLSDVYGAMQVIVDAQNRPWIQHVTAKGGESLNRETFGYAGFSNAIRLTHTHLTSYQVKMRVKFRIETGVAKTMAATGISNPVATMWNLLPWSFVVDWFLPIGRYLENVDATAGCTFLSGVRSSRFRSEVVTFGQGTSSTGAHGPWTYAGLGSSSKRREIVRREVLTAFPTNPLPAFKNPVSFDHMFNGLSLLQLAFKR